MKRIAAFGIVGFALVGAGCVEPARQRVIVASPEPMRPQASVKRISSDGAGGLVLPDGTRVELDERGGFALPNGAYVRRDASGALNLPNGARCVPDMDGFACP
jgi:hypothetical protein